MADQRPGYTDTPRLPNSAYHVHDPERPHPPAVDPPEPTTSAPPSDATALFDAGLDDWEHPDGSPAEWTVEDGYVESVPDTGDIRTTEPIGDCQLHLEWMPPANVEGDGQARANSGVFLMDRYEIQILDCYDNPTYADGYTAAVFGQTPPRVNACRPPGEWQSFDILWRAPRFADGTLESPARVTLLHNGVAVHDATELVGPTTNSDVLDYEPHASADVLRLQDHGDRVRFRNLWYRPLSG